MNKKQKIILSFIIILFIGCIGFILFKKWNLNQKYWKLKNEQKKDLTTLKTKKEKEQKQGPRFFFYSQNKYWIESKYQNFWTKKTEQNSEIPFNWTIGNYLNYFWPNWNKYYLINPNTLQRTIKKTNIVWYQPQEIIKRHKYRKEINLISLQELDIDPTKFQTTEQILQKLVNLIQNPNINWTNLSNFINWHFTTKQSQKLKKIFQNNFWSFEWTGFYPD